MAGEPGTLRAACEAGEGPGTLTGGYFERPAAGHPAITAPEPRVRLTARVAPGDFREGSRAIRLASPS
jgi:hypothetical protein